jgi:nicotinamidase-related amidase
MSYAPLKPEEAVVLFADLQAGIIERSTTVEPDRLRRAVAALAKLAKLFDIPVVVTTAPVAGRAPQVTPEISAALGELSPHVRTTTDAFLDSATCAAILATGRKTLIVSGVATEVIVQHTALSAVAHGLASQVVVDVCGGLSPRTEDAALRRLVQAGVAPTSIVSLAGQLAGDFTQPRGAQARAILHEMVGR